MFSIFADFEKIAAKLQIYLTWKFWLKLSLMISKAGPKFTYMAKLVKLAIIQNLQIWLNCQFWPSWYC